MQTLQALIVLAFAGQVFLSNAIILRQRNSTVASGGLKVGQTVTVAPSALASVPGAVALANQVKPVRIHDDVSYEVINKTSIERKSTSDCLCKIGSFWHWRIKSCVKQGGWGYECGFFPEEHHNKVCADGLKCEPLAQDRVQYFHPGARPASCQNCKPEDGCLTGKTRHEKNCLKEFKLTGQACQTVTVTVTATAEVKVSETVEKTGKAAATAAAEASQKASSKDGKASAVKKATAQGEATATAKASHTAEAEATATEKGTANGTACVNVSEVKEMLNLHKVPRIGAVLSSTVVSSGDAEAFDRAYAEALEAAKAAGLLNAQQAAEALARAEAREHAANEAEAKANEAAAWKAEAGAKASAQDKAKEEALKAAKGAANGEAAKAKAAAAAAGANSEAANAKANAAQKAANAAAENTKAGNQAGDEAEKAAAAKAAKAKADAAAKANAEAAKAAAAKAQAEAVAKEAAARAEAINDIVSPSGTEAPARPTTPKPTGPPRKISPEEIAAQNP